MLSFFCDCAELFFCFLYSDFGLTRDIYQTDYYRKNSKGKEIWHCGERRGEEGAFSILLKLTAEKNWSHGLVFPLNAAPKRVLHPWLFVIRLPIPVQNWWTCLLCCSMDLWVVKSICSIAHLHQTCRSSTSPMVASWIFEGWTLRNCQRCLVSRLRKKY